MTTEPHGAGQADVKSRYAKAETLLDLLKLGLPDYYQADEDFFESPRLARDLDISFQAVYKWFTRNSVSTARAKELITKSEETVHRPEDFTPLCRDDFWPFM